MSWNEQSTADLIELLESDDRPGVDRETGDVPSLDFIIASLVSRSQLGDDEATDHFNDYTGGFCCVCCPPFEESDYYKAGLRLCRRDSCYSEETGCPPDPECDQCFGAGYFLAWNSLRPTPGTVEDDTERLRHVTQLDQEETDRLISADRIWGPVANLIEAANVGYEPAWSPLLDFIGSRYADLVGIGFDFGGNGPKGRGRFVMDDHSLEDFLDDMDMADPRTRLLERIQDDLRHAFCEHETVVFCDCITDGAPALGCEQCQSSGIHFI